MSYGYVVLSRWDVRLHRRSLMIRMCSFFWRIFIGKSSITPDTGEVVGFSGKVNPPSSIVIPYDLDIYRIAKSTVDSSTAICNVPENQTLGTVRNTKKGELLQRDATRFQGAADFNGESQRCSQRC